MSSQTTRVVTISATYGAGGSVIGPRLAQRLSLPFADRLIPARDAPTVGEGGEQVTEAERLQISRNRFLARLAALTGGLGMPVPHPEDLSDPIRRRVEQSIHDLVDAGGAVVLGRAASIVLAGHPRSFHVRLDGPDQRRVSRAMAIERIDADTARARLVETDSARARYLDRLYEHDPSDPRLYHLVVDSTVLDTDDCVELVAGAAESFWRQGTER